MQLASEEGLRFLGGADNATEQMPLTWHPGLADEARKYGKAMQQAAYSAREVTGYWQREAMGDLTRTARTLAQRTRPNATAIAASLRGQARAMPLAAELHRLVRAFTGFENDLLRFKVALSRALTLRQLLPRGGFRARFAALAARLRTEDAYAETYALARAVADHIDNANALSGETWALLPGAQEVLTQLDKYEGFLGKVEQLLEQLQLPALRRRVNAAAAATSNYLALLGRVTNVLPALGHQLPRAVQVCGAYQEGDVAIAHHPPCTQQQAGKRLVCWLSNNARWKDQHYADRVIPPDFQPEGYTPAWCSDIHLLRQRAGL